LRQRHGGAWRRARRRVPRARPAIRPQVSGVLSHRRCGRRARPHHRRVLCLDLYWGARLPAQGITSPGRDAVYLPPHHSAAPVASAGAVRQVDHMTTPAPDLTQHPAALALASRHRLRWWEPIPWILAIAFYFLFPRYLGFGTDLLVMILFALSLELAL